MSWRPLFPFLFCAFLGAQALAQPAVLGLFDENDAIGADYFNASSGSSSGDDFLLLAGPGVDKLPLELSRAYSGQSSGLLRWHHGVGGGWEIEIGPENTMHMDLTGFDSLIVYLNGPAAISGGELPRIGLTDGSGKSADTWLSVLEDVRVNTLHSGFTAESATNVFLLSEYANVIPREQRRPGYPGNLVITFADVPLDTSRAAIGAPATPANFKVSTEVGANQLDFSFRDTDGDHTLGAIGEYIDVLLPEEEGSSKLRPTWRITVTVAPGSVVVPGAGDTYRLVVSFDEFALDDDPDSWQRRGVPISSLSLEDGFSLADVAAVFFRNGGATAAERTLWVDRITAVRNDDDAFLDDLQRHTFDFFWFEANPANGLVKDRSSPTSASSIASVGFALSAYTVGIDRGWISRQEGVARTLTTLRFFWNAPQSSASTNVTGYKGFFYHFLDMNTGYRRGTTELSTIDSALLLGGVLHAGEYFDGPGTEEEEIRQLARSIYERVDWAWAQVRPPAISHGWRPESGFIGNDWKGYNEAMIVYILALGSPTHPVEPSAWDAWTSGYGSDWRTEYGYTYLTFPPLFGHQYSHVWIDFRGIQDAFMRGKGSDYFENSRLATLAQRAYHIANPNGWPNYGADEWGLTASDTPVGYRARGAPPAQNDDGTLVPTAPGGSIVFTPEESIAALRTMKQSYPGLWGPYGFYDAYNVALAWIDDDYIGIDQGPILLMAENYRTGRIWDVFMLNEAVQRGLDQAGFEPIDTAVETTHPTRARKLGNFPNPFSRQTEIRYTTATPGKVRLVIYDLLGREVAVPVNQVLQQGDHSAVIKAVGLPSGLYFYRLTSPAGTATGKMMLVR